MFRKNILFTFTILLFIENGNTYSCNPIQVTPGEDVQAIISICGKLNTALQATIDPSSEHSYAVWHILGIVLIVMCMAAAFLLRNMISEYPLTILLLYSSLILPLILFVIIRYRHDIFDFLRRLICAFCENRDLRARVQDLEAQLAYVRGELSSATGAEPTTIEQQPCLAAEPSHASRVPSVFPHAQEEERFQRPDQQDEGHKGNNMFNAQLFDEEQNMADVCRFSECDEDEDEIFHLNGLNPSSYSSIRLPIKETLPLASLSANDTTCGDSVIRDKLRMVRDVQSDEDVIRQEALAVRIRQSPPPIDFESEELGYSLGLTTVMLHHPDPIDIEPQVEEGHGSDSMPAKEGRKTFG